MPFMHPALLATAISTGTLRILFFGNSHTAVNHLPSMVQSLLQSDGHHSRCVVQMQSCAFLNDVDQAEAARVIAQGWDFIVLQGATLSSSHKYKYPNDVAVALANEAGRSGAKVLFFAEWPREGWNESDWIVNSYREIFGPKARVVDIPHIFDAVHAKFPNVGLWAPDGNHAAVAGTFVGACSIYRWIVGSGKEWPTFVPGGVSEDFARATFDEARSRYTKIVKD